MKVILLGAALILGQLQSAQKEEVVRLPPHQASLRASYGGKMVELLYAAPSVSLPKQVPKLDAQGGAWYVDVKNLGPADVILEGNGGFVVHLQPKRMVRVRAAGNTYSFAAP